MKSFAMICVGVLSMMSSAAFAGPPSPMQMTSPVVSPNIHAINVPDCANGFQKGSVSGNGPTQIGTWTCTTPVISCPRAQNGLGGGLYQPKAISVANGGERFSYMCSYNPIPR